MIGGGDVSPFAGIFSILTIFMVAAAVGLIVGVVIMIVLAVKNRASQNNMIQTMPMERFCICLVVVLLIVLFVAIASASAY